MYAMPEMINLGLKKDQKFPTETHKQVAQNIAIGNPSVFKRELLEEIVEAVCRVPEKYISTITMDQMVDAFGCPDVF